MSLGTAATSYLARIALRSDSVSAVLPEPTGPPMPTLNGCVTINSPQKIKCIGHRGHRDHRGKQERPLRSKSDGNQQENLVFRIWQLAILCVLCVLCGKKKV